MGRHLQQGFKSAAQRASICRLTPAALLWAVKLMPADACRTDVSCESCLNLANDTCPTAVSSEACASWHLPHWCEQSSMSESDDWHMPHSCEQWSMPESADWHLPHCLWWKWNGSNCTRNNTVTSDLSSSQIKMMTLAHIVNLGGLLYSDLCETLCVCVCVSEWVCVCVSVCLWKWQWGGGEGGESGGRSNFLQCQGSQSQILLELVYSGSKKNFKMLTTRHDATHTDFFFLNNNPALT